MIIKKRNYLKQIYKQNTESKAYIIEVSVDYYHEIFNGWDPSPIKRRDIEPDLLDFIEQCAYDIPLKYNIELHFYLPKSGVDVSKEQLTLTGIKNNFQFIIHFINRKLRVIRRKILLYIMMSFSFLVSGYLFKQYLTLGVLTTPIFEGLVIGGWVFLWEAFSLFFFSSQEIRGRLRRYLKFVDSPIYFYYI